MASNPSTGCCQDDLLLGPPLRSLSATCVAILAVLVLLSSCGLFSSSSSRYVWVYSYPPTHLLSPNLFLLPTSQSRPPLCRPGTTPPSLSLSLAVHPASPASARFAGPQRTPDIYTPTPTLYTQSHDRTSDCATSRRCPPLPGHWVDHRPVPPPHRGRCWCQRTPIATMAFANFTVPYGPAQPNRRSHESGEFRPCVWCYLCFLVVPLLTCPLGSCCGSLSTSRGS